MEEGNGSEVTEECTPCVVRVCMSRVHVTCVYGTCVLTLISFPPFGPSFLPHFMFLSFACPLSFPFFVSSSPSPSLRVHPQNRPKV